MQSPGAPGKLLDFPEIPNKDDIVDWTYLKRRDMQEIVPGIFLGPYSAAKKSQFDNLKAHSITHIVCIRQEIEANFVKANFINDFKYLILDIADLPTENIIKHFPQVKTFIDEGLSSGGNVLLHGNTGISRSAALMIAYIMETYGLSYRDAFQHVQQKRFCINPNEGFAHQLMEYEPIYLAKYQARHQLDCREVNKNNAEIKRPFEDEMDGDDDMDSS